VRVRSDRSPLRPGAHVKCRPDGHRGAEAGGDQAAAHSAALRVVGDRAVCSPNTRPTPTRMFAEDSTDPGRISYPDVPNTDLMTVNVLPHGLATRASLRSATKFERVAFQPETPGGRLVVHC